jgi:DNA-directed RNA polymerase subunit M/transcription elongation factor TFIIS
MKLADQAGEWLRLCHHYRTMTDEELLNLARQKSSLTETASQILASEMSSRRLQPPPEEPPALVFIEPDPDSPYAEDREPVEICTVWSLRDALQLQRILDGAGIPFFIDKEKGTAVDAATLNFGEGVSVSVMRIAIPWIREPMENYHPADEPPEVKPETREVWPRALVTCPKCHSTEVIFECRNPEPQTREEVHTANFEWTCPSCGHQWLDDGLAKER